MEVRRNSAVGLRKNHRLRLLAAVVEEQHTFLPPWRPSLAAYDLVVVPVVEHLRALDFVWYAVLFSYFQGTVYSFILNESNLVVLVAHHNSDKNSFYR